MHADGPSPSCDHPIGRALVWLLLAVAFLCFLVLKAYSLHFETGDENVYLYMAWATARHGAWPYVDYFFAHPPLHLLPGIVLFLFTEIGPITARAIPIAATLVGAILQFQMARRHVGGAAAIVVVVAYLFSFAVLRASTHWTGINLATMWTIAGLSAFAAGRPIFCGVAFALGVATGNYVFPGAMMAGVAFSLRSRRDAVRYAMSFLAPWAILQGVALVVAGREYFDAVYRYHLEKPDAPGMALRMSAQVFSDDFFLFAATLVAPIVARFDRVERGAIRDRRSMLERLRISLVEDGSRSLARLGVLWVVGYLVFFSMLAKVFPFYFLLVVPTMAICAGYVVDRCLRHVIAGVQSTTASSRRKSALFAMSIVAAFAVAFTFRKPIRRHLAPNYERAADRPMTWRDARVPWSVNRFLRSCCFEDVAKAHTDYGTITESLFHESRYFEVADQLADWVRSNSSEDEVIFGESPTAGLVAVLAGRRIAMDFVDTNVMRFQSGLASATDTIHRLKSEKLAFVLVAGPRPSFDEGRCPARFASLPEFCHWLSRDFRVAVSIEDPTNGAYHLLEPRNRRAK